MTTHADYRECVDLYKKEVTNLSKKGIRDPEQWETEMHKINQRFRNCLLPGWGDSKKSRSNSKQSLKKMKDADVHHCVSKYNKALTQLSRASIRNPGEWRSKLSEIERKYNRCLDGSKTKSKTQTAGQGTRKGTRKRTRKSRNRN